ncbi:MAG: hypothetical protein ACP5U0_10480, partial [Caldisphaera sp.]
FLIIFSLVILAIQYHIMSINSNMLSKNPHTPVNFLIDLNTKILTILFVIIISAFTILLRPKWLIFIVPYFFLLFYSNNYVFEYPGIMQFQYGTLVTPFIFLALSDFFSKRQKKKEKTTSKKRVLLKFEKKTFHVAISIFLIIVVTSTTAYFNPISPLNKYSPINFDFYEKDMPNYTIYNDLEKLISLIPSDDPYVMVQQNIPEVYPRPFYPNVGLLSVWGGGIAFNSSDNNFYVFNTVKGWVKADIQYVLYDPYSEWDEINGISISAFLPINNSTYQNMFNMVWEMLASGQYGILGEADGMVLLERGYYGALKYYKPMEDIFYVSKNTIKNQIPDMYHDTNWTFVSPGSYEIELFYHMKRSYTGNISFYVTAWGRAIFNVEKYVNLRGNSSVILSFNFTENFPYLYVSFIFPNDSKGFDLQLLQMYQVKQPSNNYYESRL